MKRRSFLAMASLALAGTGIAAKGTDFSFSDRHELSPLLEDEAGKRIRTADQWQEQRKVIKARWSEFLGILEPNPEKPVIRVIKEERTGGIIRQLVQYEGEPGITDIGYLLKPEHISSPLPGIVAMHSTSDNQMKFIAGVERGRILPFGYRLAQQGHIVFCPQCFLWHDKDLNYVQATEKFKKRHPGSRGMAKMLFDAQRAVDVLVSLDETDPSRIGATGHSLGAKEVLYLGAFDDRVKVIVSNEGGIGIDFSNWDDVWYLGKEIHDFGHQQHEILALNAPKPFLLIGGDSADGEKSRPYIEAVRPVYALYGKDPHRLELRNHGAGHSPTSQAEQWHYEWIGRFL